ncbi:tRNA (N(6)-L-threonylcarbamoyladenosine(37)-C(2))-methylthiotransferase MtaB [Sphingobium sufflavum]|uniref:tRNA (N(6)-L-threonylcarbamoyladenosine(37)-C(2))- methylthiotransferase MtaB n=1 Tax=Sphingobium sufflavum TaxID=1129547 RepID=UPI001F34382F|nr:tRNA (N(6)-L-threonylcarbamoyladenosine(37)-C(2))-methylthiotransferase MtaB [Sphingobium sufflavum]MCE7798774.1 tRNA (N(6)-L-threonylcarbamoyladenosine(37)-C(2))-methylthiotransferase MtaB [Sphingobium sufflavum]
MTAPEIITLGCRLNIAESSAMAELAGDADDLIIVNSCAVTAEAVRQTRQAIRKARRRRPDARLIVTGCAAQTDPAMFTAMPEVDRVLGNREKLLADGFGRETGPKAQVADIMTVRDVAPHMASAYSDRTRGFVVVQNGCDHRCTFCIIPYGRGPSISVPAGAVVDQVRRLVDTGIAEIVITGVDVTSYGHDLPGTPTLGLLVERILKGVPDLPRLRLSSLDGVEIDERLFDLLTGEARVMPHVHLSLQAGDDMILKRMKRRHSRSQAVDLVARLHERRPDIAIGADIIAGFPTEDAAMFDNSLSLVADCRIVHGHIFPYSPRTGTPATRMPPVAPPIVRERAARLRAACAEQRTAWLTRQIGDRVEVLVERSGNHGHAANFAPVRLSAPAQPGKIVSARVTGLEADGLIAQESGHD